MVNENDLKVDNFGSTDSLYMLDEPETFRPCSPDYSPPDDTLTPPSVAEKKSWAEVARTEKKNTIMNNPPIGIPFNYADFKTSVSRMNIHHDWSDDDYWSGEQGTYGSPATPPF
jgi:hypothetical protein